MDKLRAITFFCRAVEARSFAAAGRSMGVVPSAMSKAISALENELGFPLMIRSTRRLTLTEEGTAYYDRCSKLLEELNEAEAMGREGKLRPRGTLRVGFHPALRMKLMGSLVRFLNEQPDIKVETLVTNAPSAVLDEGLDLLLRIGSLPDSNLVSRRLGSVRTVVCASPRYLEAWGEPRTPMELVRHRALIYGRHDEDPSTRWAFVRGEEEVVVDVPVRVVSRDGIGLLDAAVGDCGVVRPFDFAVGELVAAGALRMLLPQWSGRPQPLQAVWPSHGARVAAKAAVFLEFVGGVLSSGNAPSGRSPLLFRPACE
jgi:DNA-binding transcriptional LysR family regulator